ncbi:imm11 family protein [Pseudomonas sp. NPDC090592]|uniref:imm11 family protein n=1 Tax=Pseudomonas sp. NPDC090592 TaxID=3364480 RepID=UPI00383AE42D
MKTIYELHSDTEHYSSFIQIYGNQEESIIGRSMEQKWTPFKSNYKPIYLELTRSDSGKKNYNFDFSGSLTPFLIFSNPLLEALESILIPRGQILEVKTESKRRKFSGYYPTNPLKNCLDLERSKYQTASHGLIIDNPVLKEQYISDEYIFTLAEDISRIFVTEKFKEVIESRNFHGFDFSKEISLSTNPPDGTMLGGRVKTS